MPFLTKYKIVHDQLITQSAHQTLHFDVSKLENIKEDKDFLELDFGNLGLCLIPLNIFISSNERANFYKCFKGASEDLL